MVGVGGWLAACCAATVALLAWRTLGTRMEAVTRACHELRGPLTAARLGLQLGARAGDLSAERLRALDLELGRAGLALDDLGAMGTRHRSTPASTPVDMGELVSSSVEAWRGAAAARGCELRAVWFGPPAAVRGDRLRLAQATGESDRQRDRARWWGDRGSRALRGRGRGQGRGARQRPGSARRASRADPPRPPRARPARAWAGHRDDGGACPRGTAAGRGEPARRAARARAART